MPPSIKNPYPPAFGSPMPMRTWSDPNTKYKYGFNGKEIDKGDEGMGGGGSTYDYGFRIYNSNLGRFLSVDPLIHKFPMLTGFQFASNTPLWAIDLDGLEAATINKGVKTLIIVVQGKNTYGPPDGKTQAQNDPNNKTGIEYTGISKIAADVSDNKEVQVVVFSSSQTENTKDDILATIQAFYKENPNGKLILAGHSLGADNLVELVNEHTEIKVDHMELLDICDEYDDDNIPSNVKSVWNRYVIDESPGGATAGGEKIEIDDVSKTSGGNIGYTGTTHTTIDQDLSDEVSKSIQYYIPIPATKVTTNKGGGCHYPAP